MGKHVPPMILWADLETTGLEVVEGKDHVLEVAVLVTDLDLNPWAGYHEAIKMTKGAALALKANDYVREMHTKNGLIKDCLKSEVTLEQAEANIIDLLKTETSFNQREFQLGGSGVAHFDDEIFKRSFPNLQKWLSYELFDIGVYRRMSRVFAGKFIVNSSPASYDEGVKVHRAFDDVKAHIEEARKYRDLFRETF